MKKEEVIRRKYSMFIKEEGSPHYHIMMSAVKEDIEEYIQYLDMVCPICYKNVIVDRLKDGKYFCMGCNKEYIIGDYHFVRWEGWMGDSWLPMKAKF